MKNITAIAETIMHTLKDNRLIPMIKILADLRRDFLAHEPGTAAQASSYKRYEKYWATARTMDLMKLVRATTGTCCPAERGARTRFTSPRSSSREKLGISLASGIGLTTLILFTCRFLSILLSTNNLLQPASSGLFNSHRKATSNRPQATSYKRQASSDQLFKKIFHVFPSGDERWVGGPAGYKLADRGSRIKIRGPWTGGLD
jgi:hypothetical protein